MDRLMKTQDVARVFGVTVKAVERWISEKRIPYIKISSKCIRFRQSAIQGYLRSRTVKPEVRNSLRTTQNALTRLK
jgi:excisionase family DNA binding protein